MNGLGGGLLVPFADPAQAHMAQRARESFHESVERARQIQNVFADVDPTGCHVRQD